MAVLREPKGHLDLLEAIAPLCRENPKLHLLIVGDGEPVMSRLKAASAQYGIERQVHLPGYRADAARLMAGFDVFALPSHKEAAGTVFLEAAQAGVPIIATRVGGIPADRRPAHAGGVRRTPPGDGPRRPGLDPQRTPLHGGGALRSHRTSLPPVARGIGTWPTPSRYRC